MSEIKTTPTLTGKDVTRFQKMMKDNENRRVSAEEYQAAKLAHKEFGFDKIQNKLAAEDIK